MLDRNLRVTVIYNPMSGTLNAEAALPGALNALRSFGWQVDMQATTCAGDAGRLAALARDQHQQVVLIVGGDGSLNEAANALANSAVALGVLPAGTANVWARQVGLPVPSPLQPNRLAEAAQMLLAGSIKPIDLGRARDRYFVLWSGIGLDAEVTATIEPRPKWSKRLGVISYSLHALFTMLRFRGTRMTVIVDEQSLKCRALMVLVSNAQLYGGVAEITPDAKMDDGVLDVCIFKGDSFFQALRHMLRAMLRLHTPDPELIQVRGRRISVVARRKCYVHVDAEPSGQTPITIEVAPQALQMIVPASAPKSLFVDQGN